MKSPVLAGKTQLVGRAGLACVTSQRALTVYITYLHGERPTAHIQHTQNFIHYMTDQGA